MAAIAPMWSILPGWSPGRRVEEQFSPLLSKPESSFALPVSGSSEDPPPAPAPAPAAAVSPRWVPPPTPVEHACARDPLYMKEHGGLGLRPKPNVHREQSMRIAKIALDYYNKKKKIKFELVEVRPANSMLSSFCPYKHTNFIARSRKEGSQEQLFFAELQPCARRQTPNGYSVICCEPLGSDSTAGRRGMDKPQGTSPKRKNVDFTYCFGCRPTMLHPKGTKYVAGHCKAPRNYDYTI